MVGLHEVLIGVLDVIGLRMAGKAKLFESAAIVLVERFDALGGRGLGLAIAIFGEDAAGITIFVARPGAGCAAGSAGVCRFVGRLA